MLGHLERDDLGVRGAATGNVAVVEAEDACARSITTVGRNAVVAELGLVLAKGDTGDLAAVVLVRKGSKGAPATTDIEEAVGRLEVKLVIGEWERELMSVSAHTWKMGRWREGVAGGDKTGSERTFSQTAVSLLSWSCSRDSSTVRSRTIPEV